MSNCSSQLHIVITHCSSQRNTDLCWNRQAAVPMNIDPVKVLAAATVLPCEGEARPLPQGKAAPLEVTQIRADWTGDGPAL